MRTEATSRPTHESPVPRHGMGEYWIKSGGQQRQDASRFGGHQKRLVVSGVMPINERRYIFLSVVVVVLLLTVPSIWSDGPNPVDLQVRGASESGVRLSIELPLRGRNSRLSMLGVF